MKKINKNSDGKSNIKLTKFYAGNVNMAIIKYKNHTSFNVTKNRMVELNNPTLSFDFICREDVVKEIDKLCNKKASQNTYISVRIIKENKDLISYFSHHNFNNSLSCSTFLLPLNMPM